MTRTDRLRGAVRAHRLVLTVSTAVGVLLVAGAIAIGGATTGTAAGAPPSARVLGPGPVTIRITIDRSRFRTAPIRVRPHTEARFVLVNHDPIGHEFIIGGPEVHARHANGHEASHPPVPGEVSVAADSTASTTYAFHTEGPVEYACHLPGHYQYGMHGVVEVVSEP
jgi:uncharacterized cupredoxin-like copper-binding protein